MRYAHISYTYPGLSACHCNMGTQNYVGIISNAPRLGINNRSNCCPPRRVSVISERSIRVSQFMLQFLFCFLISEWLHTTTLCWPSVALFEYLYSFSLPPCLPLSVPPFLFPSLRTCICAYAAPFFFASDLVLSQMSVYSKNHNPISAYFGGGTHVTTTSALHVITQDSAHAIRLTRRYILIQYLQGVKGYSI